MAPKSKKYFKNPKNGLERYVNDVSTGEVITCDLIKKAVSRFVNLHKKRNVLNYEYRERSADIAVAFILAFCKHSKGKWAGKPVALEDWQEFAVRQMFGWYDRTTGARLITHVYIEIARKNGKTLFASALALYMLLADGEGGAEVYSVATKRDQAKIAFSNTVAMVQQSSALNGAVRDTRSGLYYDKNYSKFEPLSSDGKTMDGLNPHFVIMDEIHAWNDRGSHEKLETAIGAREQPIILGITTAGFDKTSLCYDLHKYGRGILNGEINDNSFLPLIFTLDDGDSYHDESTWIKANPNLGVSKFLRTLRKGYEKAIAMPSTLNAWLTLELNMWVDSQVRWIGPDKWESLATDEKMREFKGKQCYVGLDLSSVADITAIYVLFVNADGSINVFPKFFIPEARMKERVDRDGVPYDVWVREGWLETTPTERICQKTIVREIKYINDNYEIRHVGYDPWNAEYIVAELKDEKIDTVMVRQGYKTMSPAAKKLEAMIYDCQVKNDGNQVMNWMMSNVVMEQDSAGNIKPSKKASTEKIDGVAALLTAIAVAMTNIEEIKESIYDSRGFIEV